MKEARLTLSGNVQSRNANAFNPITTLISGHDFADKKSIPDNLTDAKKISLPLSPEGRVPRSHPYSYICHQACGF